MNKFIQEDCVEVTIKTLDSINTSGKYDVSPAKKITLEFSISTSQKQESWDLNKIQDFVRKLAFIGVSYTDEKFKFLRGYKVRT